MRILALDVGGTAIKSAVIEEDGILQMYRTSPSSPVPAQILTQYAIDATFRPRPDGRTIVELFSEIREKYPDQLFMADCATFEQAQKAEEMGFDFIGTTLNGYTDDTRQVPPPNFELMKRLATELHTPIIAEGGIFSPEQLLQAINQGVLACVVGSAITRPMKITQHYVKALQKKGE